MLGSAHHRLSFGASLIRLAVCRTAPGTDILIRPEQMRLLNPAYTFHSFSPIFLYKVVQAFVVLCPGDRTVCQKPRELLLPQKQLMVFSA